jgi:hypothetical protein
VVYTIVLFYASEVCFGKSGLYYCIILCERLAPTKQALKKKIRLKMAVNKQEVLRLINSGSARVGFSPAPANWTSVLWLQFVRITVDGRVTGFVRCIECRQVLTSRGE